MPVLLVAGEEDPKYLAIARTMAIAIRHASLAVVPRVGHVPHLERCEAFLCAVVPFLGEALEPVAATLNPD
jgi:pimeloyl-ACP methyl ester carboxylesterase